MWENITAHPVKKKSNFRINSEKKFGKSIDADWLKTAELKLSQLYHTTLVWVNSTELL